MHTILLLHRCDGCWLRVCEGSIQETRYKINGETDEMEVTSDEIFAGKQVVHVCIKNMNRACHIHIIDNVMPFSQIIDDAPAFIKDSMGYHRIGNPESTPAVTLHLYCPPFQQCKIWLDPSHASNPSKACMCNYSEYGVKHTCEMFEVNMI